MSRNTPLVDQFSRTISYLRLSLTDRCNLRCMYCMPDPQNTHDVHLKSGRFLRHEDLLSYEELLRIVRLAVSLGMSKIRLTGGEPLLRKDILHFVDQLAQVDGLSEIRLTTNGVLLPDMAKDLFRYGVRQINVSLDTLKRDKFASITGRDFFDQVISGLDLAQELGFAIKINVVAMRGVNDEEFVDFAALAVARQMQVRFIEFMPVGDTSIWDKRYFIGAQEIRERLASLGSLTPVEQRHSDGPARVFRLKTDAGSGSVGFISPISHHFCDLCNRLRLTSEGRLRSCLLNDKETDLKAILRGGGDDQSLIDAITTTVLSKPKGHELRQELGKEASGAKSGRMSRIGG